MKRSRPSLSPRAARAVLAGLACLACLAAAPAALADDAGDAAKRAQTVTRLNGEGTTFFKARDYRRALERFNEAYALEAEPDLLYNIARCHEALGETAVAIEKYRRYVDEPGADAEGRARARAKLRSLEAAPPAPAPGSSAGAANATSATGAPGATNAPGAAAEGRSYSPWTWLTLGVGLAAAGGGTAAFLLGASDHREVTDAPGYGDPSQVSTLRRSRAEELIDAGDTKKTIGVALWAAGGAALATSAVLFLLERPGPRERTAWLGVAPARGGAALSLQGRF